VIPVKACTRIVSDGGVRLADAGDRGMALPNQKPSRPHHFGRVPVVWSGHRRAFWVKPDSIEATNGSNLEACVTPEPIEESIPMIPMGHEGFHFGHNLRTLRKSRKLSQEELAAKMATSTNRVSQTTISNWERRADCPAGCFLDAAAKALDVPAFVFFTELDCNALGVAADFLKELSEEICI
jgi:DNA-binding XRE family transcriptional regulator